MSTSCTGKLNEQSHAVDCLSRHVKNGPDKASHRIEEYFKIANSMKRRCRRKGKILFLSRIAICIFASEKASSSKQFAFKLKVDCHERCIVVC
jgi:hypothetical protein